MNNEYVVLYMLHLFIKEYKIYKKFQFHFYPHNSLHIKLCLLKKNIDITTTREQKYILIKI